MSSSFSFQTVDPVREKVNVSSPTVLGLTTAGTYTVSTGFHPVSSWTKRQLTNNAESIVDFAIRLSFTLAGSAGQIAITGTQLPQPKYTNDIFMNVDQTGITLTAGNIIRARLVSGVNNGAGTTLYEGTIVLEQVDTVTGNSTIVTSIPSTATININGSYISK